MSEHYPQNIQSSLTGDRPSNDVIISNFSDHLKKRGHSDGTRYAYQAALMHFICWQNKKSPQAQTIDRVNVTFFLQEHLPVCHCSPPAFKHLKTVRAALNQLLLMQGQKRLQEIDFNCYSVSGN